MKKTFDNMFGFIFKQTIVQTLIDFRVISIVSILFGGWFVWQLWVWYSKLMMTLLEQGRELPQGWDVAFLGFAGIAVTAFWKAVNHIVESINRGQE